MWKREFVLLSLQMIYIVLRAIWYELWCSGQPVAFQSVASWHRIRLRADGFHYVKELQGTTDMNLAIPNGLLATSAGEVKISKVVVLATLPYG